MQHLFLALLIHTSGLLFIGPPKLLTPILPLFPLLSRRFLNLTRNTNTNFSIVLLNVSTKQRREKRYFKFLEVCFRIINQSEASRFSTAVLSTNPECLGSFFGGFVE